MSITYDELYIVMAIEGTKSGNNTSIQCISEFTSSSGRFNDEIGICKFLFSNGYKAFAKYKGSVELWKKVSAKFEFIDGTVKYKPLSG